MAEQAIPALNDGLLWCSCRQPMPEARVPASCPTCDRETNGLVIEAKRNMKVCAFIEQHPIDWGLPALGESNTDWWARMVAAWESKEADL